MDAELDRRGAKDDFYLDILGGLARRRDDPFLTDLVRLLERWREPRLAHALNKNQIASKAWLIDELVETAGGSLGTVYVLGGWLAVMGALLLADRRVTVDRVLSFDLDADCAPLAEALNRSHAEAGRFVALTADVGAIDYTRSTFTRTAADGSAETVTAQPDTVINTSCEHLADFAGWYGRIPEGTLVALQSNDAVGEEGHVNCVPDLAAFEAQALLAEPMFAGALPLKRYTRFMLIGRR